MTVHDYQVLQRDENGMAHGLPVGGPYDVDGAKNVLVGDLWILAGQSNMEGCGDLIGVDLEAPSPFVHTYQSKEEWAIAEEPLHRLDETPQLVHHVLAGRDSVPDEIPPRDMGRTKGSGLGLAFAKHLYQKTSVPIGFIPSAHGGTSMQQWDPSLAREGSLSLYGATLARVKAVGDRVAGILWYQGESDANPMDMRAYQERMTRLVQAFREDLGQLDLPFYYVQLGRFAVGPEPSMVDGWNGVREAQRTWEGELPHTQMVSAIDLDLDDAIHIGTSGLKRLGRRLADVAAGTLAPRLRSAAFEADSSRLRVTFDNIRGELSADGRPSGFSLRHADGAEYFTIFKITLEGDSAILHCDAGQALPAGVQLWYGWGLDPYCNITDTQDASIPAFGPIQLL